MVIYVEGGARGELAAEARRAFAKFFEKCLERKPRVLACGSRGDALNRFRAAKKKNEDCLLLLDSEEPPSTVDPWDHPRLLEACPRPHSYVADDLHFMAAVMETWFIACPEELEVFYGQGFKSAKLPGATDLEAISRHDVFKALEDATKDTKTKGAYGKGAHSFKILACMDPARVRSRCAWARRLCVELGRRGFKESKRVAP